MYKYFVFILAFAAFSALGACRWKQDLEAFTKAGRELVKGGTPG